MARRLRSGEPPDPDRLFIELKALARPLRGPANLDPLLERIGDARVVLLGEASHGTVVELLRELRSRAPQVDGDGRDAAFVAEQNALVVKNAEAYYRAMVRANDESWNIRDRHMAETLDRLLAHHGPGSRGIVWEHNTHIGDARFTDMADDGMVNIGQRAIGVVYRPEYEHFGNYVPTVLPRRYDALLFIDRTKALRALHPTEVNEEEVPETYPSGV
jgi:erythromycin esterase-like protein